MSRDLKDKMHRALNVLFAPPDIFSFFGYCTGMSEGLREMCLIKLKGLHIPNLITVLGRDDCLRLSRKY